MGRRTAVRTCPQRGPPQGPRGAVTKPLTRQSLVLWEPGRPEKAALLRGTALPLTASRSCGFPGTQQCGPSQELSSGAPLVGWYLAMGCVQPIQGQWGLDVKHQNTGNINVAYPHVHTPASVSPSVESRIGLGPRSCPAWHCQVQRAPRGQQGSQAQARPCLPRPTGRGRRRGWLSLQAESLRGIIGGCLPGERQGVIESHTHTANGMGNNGRAWGADAVLQCSRTCLAVAGD